MFRLLPPHLWLYNYSQLKCPSLPHTQFHLSSYSPPKVVPNFPGGKIIHHPLNFHSVFVCTSVISLSLLLSLIPLHVQGERQWVGLVVKAMRMCTVLLLVTAPQFSFVGVYLSPGPSPCALGRRTHFPLTPPLDIRSLPCWVSTCCSVVTWSDQGWTQDSLISEEPGRDFRRDGEQVL